MTALKRILLFTLFTNHLTFVLSHKMRYCNRGYCYTKNDQASTINSQLNTHNRYDYDLSSDRQIRRTGFDFCTDREGHLMDCEVLEILGKEDYMPVEDSTRSQTKTRSDSHTKFEDWSWKTIYDRFNSNTKKKSEEEVRSMNFHTHWEVEPVKGHCFDYDAGYSFDCNLVKNLEQDYVLIEDLRLGGVFAAQPKSGFTRRKDIHCQAPVKTPDVLCGSEIDPVEDWRTNVEINMEGM